ncbi:hypothetical protein [Sphingomonas fuzhouensis]|uniref:hypothetical protein n=1 Tax=Sphingomonas fuzhouensis TaxID=3106033 RepID=UPI002AFF8FE0|nr:hypothetical protein [Sphingomonas sp. SGZ-02]
MRVAFVLDGCDWEAMGHVTITAEDVRNLVVATVDRRFAPVNRLPEPIEWFIDNGSAYVAGDTRHFAHAIALVPRITPVSVPQSNGIMEAFVWTLKPDDIRVSFTF